MTTNATSDDTTTPTTIATLTITEKIDFDAKRVTWTARHNRTIVATAQATLYTNAMHAALPLRSAVATHFGVSPHNAVGQRRGMRRNDHSSGA